MSNNKINKLQERHVCIICDSKMSSFPEPLNNDYADA